MNLPVLVEERRNLFSEPHFSHSRLAKYLTCPEQYRLHYLEGLRPRFPSASLVFGQLLHQALAVLLTGKGDPIAHFEASWRAVKETTLTYRARDSWERCAETGERLLQRFVAEELPKLGTVEAVEKPFTLDITTLALPFVGIIDLVAPYKGRRTVIDFKSAAKPYEAHEVLLSDQLTAYQLAEPLAEQSALCVLVKGKEPSIEWHVAKRRPEELAEFVQKAEWATQAIEAGQFYKRPGFWCAWCDFLPVCIGDDRQADETLVRLP